MYWPFCESLQFTLRSGFNSEINWRGQYRTGNQIFTQTLNSEFKCARVDLHTLGCCTCTHTPRDNQLRWETKVGLYRETKVKGTITGQMRRGKSCHLLPNRWDSIKSFFVLLMTNYISDGGSDWKTERKPQSPWLLSEWGELSGPVWGDGSRCTHVTDSLSLCTFFVVFVQYTYTVTHAHMNRLVTIIQSLSC